MSRRPVAPSFAAVGLLLAGCGDGSPAGPRFAAELSHDAGVILLPPTGSAEVAHTFRVANPSGDRPLRLTFDSKSCGCSLTSEDPVVVPPGGSAPVPVAFTLNGDQARRLSVAYRTGRADVPEVRLTLAARGRRRIRFEGSPDPTVAVRPGATARFGLTVSVTRPGGAAGGPVTLSADPPLVRVTDRYEIGRSEETDRDGRPLHGVKTHFVCEAVGDGAAGEAWDRPAVAVTLTARQGEASAETRLTLRTDSPVVVRPSRLIWTDPGPDERRTLTLSADRPFRVLGLDGGPLRPAGPLPAGAAAVQTIAVALRPEAAAAGTALHVARVRTDHPGRPRVPVPVAVLRTGTRP